MAVLIDSSVFIALERRGIGLDDLLIAATALANSYDVLTDNVREFRRVPDLAVRRPTWPG